MKRYVIALILLGTLAQGATAAVVTPDKAAKYASGLMGMSTLPVPESGTRNLATSRNGGETPEYYVFNNPDGGWAIISAEDRITPVLGYSDEGRFNIDDMPDNVAWWMDGVAQVIDIVRGSDMEAPEKVRKAWNEIQDKNNVTLSDKNTIETALWDQVEPYNDLCPIVAGEFKRSITGCVATAMAIVMRYNCWPAKGKGIIGGYTTRSTETYISSYYIDDHTYVWNNMPLTEANTAKKKWTADQKRQVAQLMHDCGVSVEMDYSYYESAAETSVVPEILKNHFSYSDKAVELYRSSYSLEEWFSIIKNEIDSKRVVLYTGSCAAGGHAFVCDGYDVKAQKLRINWGWGGYCNGFYSLDLPATDDFVFDEFQSAVIGIAPDTAIVNHNKIDELIPLPFNNLCGLRLISSGDVVKDSEIQFEAGFFMNNSNNEFDMDFKVCLMDSAGNIRQEGWPIKIHFPAHDGYIYAEYSDIAALTVTPDLTDYFKLFFRDGGNWLPVNNNHDEFPDADGICCGVTPEPVIALPASLSVGTKIDLKLTLGYIPVKSVKWSLNGKVLEGNKMEVLAGKNEIRADVEYYDDSKGFITTTINVE